MTWYSKDRGTLEDLLKQRVGFGKYETATWVQVLQTTEGAEWIIWLDSNTERLRFPAGEELVSAAVERLDDRDDGLWDDFRWDGGL